MTGTDSFVRCRGRAERPDTLQQAGDPVGGLRAALGSAGELDEAVGQVGVMDVGQVVPGVGELAGKRMADVAQWVVALPESVSNGSAVSG
ncbi:hypothetical protein [Microbispora triticiradicis]|uniref:hypothetical protein n=1 Tax=Microbispora triticiradicis TaxID=2200763 RepID=UPI001FCA70FD|nr:hypothetical protein [Microbispora triticiradicis]